MRHNFQNEHSTNKYVYSKSDPFNGILDLLFYIIQSKSSCFVLIDYVCLNCLAESNVKILKSMIDIWSFCLLFECYFLYTNVLLLSMGDSLAHFSSSFYRFFFLSILYHFVFIWACYMCLTHALNILSPFSKIDAAFSLKLFNPIQNKLLDLRWLVAPYMSCANSYQQRSIWSLSEFIWNISLFAITYRVISPMIFTHNRVQVF